MENIGLSAGSFGLLFGLLLGICLCLAFQYIRIWEEQKRIAVAVIVFAAICMGLFFYISGEKDGFANWMRGMGLFAGAFIAAPVGLYLASQRTDTLMQQTKNEGKRIISEEFSRSVKLLGNDKASVRQGGIYALGRLAEDNEAMRDTIMKIICSFVRGTGGESPTAMPNGTDIEAALYVIRERKITQTRFDISNSILENGDLSEANLAGFNLSDIQATGCIFKDTNFTKANLVSAKFLGGCDFGDAEFDQADVSNADLSMEDSLKQEQVNAMCGNGDTKLPPNVSRPPEWKEWKDN